MASDILRTTREAEKSSRIVLREEKIFNDHLAAFATHRNPIKLAWLMWRVSMGEDEK